MGLYNRDCCKFTVSCTGSQDEGQGLFPTGFSDGKDFSRVSDIGGQRLFPSVIWGAGSFLDWFPSEIDHLPTKVEGHWLLLGNLKGGLVLFLEYWKWEGKNKGLFGSQNSFPGPVTIFHKFEHPLVAFSISSGVGLYYGELVHRG